MSKNVIIAMVGTFCSVWICVFFAVIINAITDTAYASILILLAFFITFVTWGYSFFRLFSEECFRAKFFK